MKMNYKSQFDNTILNLFPPFQENIGEKDYIIGSFHDKRLFRYTDFINNQIKDNNNRKHFRKDVVLLKDNNFSVYIKFYPQLPGIEVAVNILTHQIIGWGTPLGELFKFKDGKIAWISQNINGDTLKYVLDKDPDRLKYLDPKSMSDMILMSMIINPEDGKPDNFIVEKHPDLLNRYRLVCVDNDQSFVEGFIRDTSQRTLLTRKLKPVPQVKTILYCFDNMNEPIHPKTRETFTSLNIEETLRIWLNDLNISTKKHFDLLSNQDEIDKLFTGYGCFIGVPFQKETIKSIYTKLYRIQKLLNLYPSITHFELLKYLEPKLGHRYQKQFSFTNSVKERFDKIDGQFYEKHGSFISTITDSYTILYSQFFINDKIKKYDEHGPSECLKVLDTIIKQVNENDIPIGNIESITQLEERFRQLDFSKYQLDEQRDILKALYNRKLHILTIKNCSLLNDGIMSNLILENLSLLDIRNSDITCRFIQRLSKEAINLTVLNISGCNKINYIYESRWIFYGSLKFPSLMKLNISNCESLEYISINAPNLLNIEMDSLPNLYYISFYDTKMNEDYICNLAKKHKDVDIFTWIINDHKIDLGKSNNNINYEILGDYIEILRNCDNSELFNILDESFNQNDPVSQYFIGMMYYRGTPPVNQNYKKALTWFKLSAEQGDPFSQNNIGVMYQDGLGVDVDYKEAFKWFKLSADQGHSSGLFSLGMMYFQGLGIETNYSEAMKLLKLASDQGNPYAQNNIGLMYQNGIGVEKNKEEALKWFKLAAENGNSDAQHNIYLWNKEAEDESNFNKKFDSISQNNDEAMNQDVENLLDEEMINWLNDLAEEVKSNSQNNKGAVNQAGMGVHDKELLKKSAQQGNIDAQYKIGMMYLDGLGVNINYEEAFKWLKLSAEKGHSLAQYQIGKMYQDGLGVDINYNETLKWHKLSAEQGNIDAQNNIGVMYQNGLGVDINYKEALKWFKLSAEQNHSDAQNNIGVMYQNGLGVDINYEEAFKWFKLSADQGHMIALYNIGLNYIHGLGVDINYKEALKYLKLSAEKGNPYAKFKIGTMYLEGIGVQKNHKEALKWITLSNMGFLK